MRPTAACPHGPPAHAATAGVKEAIPPIDLKPSERKHRLSDPLVAAWACTRTLTLIEPSASHPHGCPRPHAQVSAQLGDTQPGGDRRVSLSEAPPVVRPDPDTRSGAISEASYEMGEQTKDGSIYVPSDNKLHVHTSTYGCHTHTHTHTHNTHTHRRHDPRRSGGPRHTRTRAWPHPLGI